MATKHKDQLPGGPADKMKPEDFDKEALEAGTEDEMEHTTSRSLAREIAMDHLAQDPHFYDDKKKKKRKKKPDDVKKDEDYQRVEVTADGKRQLDYGVEDLNKKPEMRKRWEKIKKALEMSGLDSDDAFIDLTSQEYTDEDEAEDAAREQMEQEGAAQGIADEPQAPEDEALEEELDEALDQQDASRQEDASQEDEEPRDDEEELLEQLLRDQGYSDAEIAYIMHGHVAPSKTAEDAEVEVKEMEQDINQAKAERELQQMERLQDLEAQNAELNNAAAQLDVEHKKRLLDLEFEAARKEKEMELDFKRKEMELKLDMLRRRADAKLAPKVSISRSIKQDAARTSEDEREGK